MKTFKQTLLRTIACVLMLGMAISAIPAFAAEMSETQPSTDCKCSLTMFKYDWTRANKDGIWKENSFVSTGRYDPDVNQILGNNAAGDSEGMILGNGEHSNGYSIKGVEFKYLKVADVYQLSHKDAQNTLHAELLYAFDKTATAELLDAIGLANGLKSNSVANAIPGNEHNWYYSSEVLNTAIAASIKANESAVKNALEKYMTAQNAQAMPMTDENGCTSVSDLASGLYLIVESKVPEMVICTTAPFFVALPMTTADGGVNKNVTVYPKNETGILNLEKTVREAKADGGKHNGTDAITDGYDHNATASAGDMLEYQILSKLPTITSEATFLTAYRFSDAVSEGLTYNKDREDVTIEIYSDTACTQKIAVWKQNDGKFSVTYSENDRKMEVNITEDGLSEINGNTEGEEGNAGNYSNYVMRMTYTATLNSNETVVTGDEGNVNAVVLTWKRTSSEYYDTLTDDAHVYTYGMDLLKLFDNKTESEAEKAGHYNHVKFKIFNKTDKSWITATMNESEGIYYVSGYATEENMATVFTPNTCDAQTGHIIVKGLEDDDYDIYEAGTEKGYALLKKPVSLRISVCEDPSRTCDIYNSDSMGLIQNDSRFTADQKHMEHFYLTATAFVNNKPTQMLNNNAFDSENENIVTKNSENGIVAFKVINTKTNNGPKTGDNSAILLPTVGIIISLFSGILLLVAVKRKR